jgi:hypothetical protein
LRSSTPSSTQVGHSSALLSVAQASELLGVTGRTVIRWCETDKLPAFPKRYGRKITYQISEKAIELFLLERTEKKKFQKIDKRTSIGLQSDFVEDWKRAMEKGLMNGRAFIEDCLRNTRIFLAMYETLTTDNLKN